MTDESPLLKFRRCKEERPGQLLEAALVLFTERGFAATRLADVGRQAGVSPGTVCVYFPTKQALFLAVIGHFLLPAMENQDAIVVGAGTPRERLIALLRAKAEALTRPHMAFLAKLVMSEIGTFPDVGQDFFAAVVEPSMKQVSRLIEEGIASGAFRQVDPRIHARLLVDPLVFDAIWRVSLGHCDPHPIDHCTLLEAHLVAVLRNLDRLPTPAPA